MKPSDILKHLLELSVTQTVELDLLSSSIQIAVRSNGHPAGVRALTLFRQAIPLAIRVALARAELEELKQEVAAPLLNRCA